MAYNRETKTAMQDSYLEARRVGHTKEEARQIRDNWKIPNSTSSDEDEDEDYWEDFYDEDYDEDGDEDYD